MIGFGLVGLGLISRAHLDGLLAARDHARVVAVCDRDDGLAHRIAAEIGARAYTDYRKLMDDPEVEAVDAPVPHNLHFEIARRALEAGKHVIVEKPMAPTVAECEDLISLARERELCLSVAENTPFVPAYIAVKRMIDKGVLGPPRLVRTLISGSEVVRLSDPSNWKGRVGGTVGGAILDAGPHSFYLLQWLFGEIAAVQAVSHKLVDVSEVEDNAVVAGRLECGAIFTSQYTFTAEIPWGERLEVYGASGTVIVDQMMDPPVMHYRGKDDTSGQAVPGPGEARIMHDPKGWKFKSIAAGLSAFARAVAERRAPPVDPADGARAIEVVEAAYRSASAGGVEVLVGAVEAAA